MREAGPKETPHDIGVKEFNFGGAVLRYLPLTVPDSLPRGSEQIRKKLTQEVPMADIVVVEYMPEEVSKDPIFRLRAFEYSFTQSLAQNLGKPVLVTDPAYNSQFLLEVGYLPLISFAGGVVMANPVFTKIREGLERQYEEYSSEQIFNSKISRRGLLRLAIGSLLIVSGGTAIGAEVDLTTSNKPRTPILTEGMFRRAVILKGIQEFLKIAGEDVKVLVVYPPWLEPSLAFYSENPGLLDKDFSNFNLLKMLPGFRNNYFTGRIYQPDARGQKNFWQKSVFEIG